MLHYPFIASDPIPVCVQLHQNTGIYEFEINSFCLMVLYCMQYAEIDPAQTWTPTLVRVPPIPTPQHAARLG